MVQKQPSLRPQAAPSQAALLMAVATERLRRWPEAALKRLSLAESRVLHVPWAHLSDALLDRLDPAAVMCPLVAPGFDAVDMAGRLGHAGYGGMLLVALPAALPDPRLIRQEIARAGRRQMRVELLLPN